MPFTGPCSKPACTVRGGGVEEEGAPAEDDGSDSGGPGCILIGRGRSGGEYDCGQCPVCVRRVGA